MLTIPVLIMSQERLNWLVLSIKEELLNKINYENLINNFS